MNFCSLILIDFSILFYSFLTSFFISHHAVVLFLFLAVYRFSSSLQVLGQTIGTLSREKIPETKVSGSFDTGLSILERS